jgi:tetratricopeptide (TPR) repeat protein
MTVRRWVLRAARAALVAVLLAASGAASAQGDPRKAAAIEEAGRLNARVLELLEAGKYDEAIPLGERALALDEAALDADSHEVAVVVNNLAELYRAKGDYVRAEPLYVRALAIEERALGPDHLDVAVSLNNLAEL